MKWWSHWGGWILGTFAGSWMAVIPVWWLKFLPVVLLAWVYDMWRKAECS